MNLFLNSLKSVVGVYSISHITDLMLVDGSGFKWRTEQYRYENRKDKETNFFLAI